MFFSCFYHPQRSCGKVMFLHLAVILFTGGRGCLADTHLGRHLRGAHTLGTHPQAHTSPAHTPLAHTPGQTPHPTSADTPRQTPPAPPTPRETATAADGTHPTGMHFCFVFVFERLMTMYSLICSIYLRIYFTTLIPSFCKFISSRIHRMTLIYFSHMYILVQWILSDVSKDTWIYHKIFEKFLSNEFNFCQIWTYINYENAKNKE